MHRLRPESEPKTIGESREGEAVAQPQVRLSGGVASEGRRRPSGEPASLPREAPGGVWIWIGAAAVIALAWGSAQVWPGAASWWGGADDLVLEQLSEHRNPALSSVANGLNAIGSEWTILVLRWSLVVVLVVYQRWRHLMAGLGAILAVEWIAARAALEVGRAGLAADETVGPIEGFSHPSLPLIGLTVTLVVIGYALFPSGRRRGRWFVVAGISIGLATIGSLYLGRDHPTDIVAGVFFSAAAGMVAFRLLVPDAAFPVTYSRSRAAHLDVGGARNDAIRKAMQDQLLDASSLRSAAVRSALMSQLGCGLVGCDLAELEPFGLAGSAGSTPVRMRITGAPDAYVFGKLYATNHLRSDRWYKTGRAILYGSLEDEAPFTSVRRLVEYEDYMLRVFRDAGLPTPRPYGFVEITPQREYLLVTEFIGSASEINQVEVDDAIIDQALSLVRRLWDADLAHRDIKPANLLVRDGEVMLIDVAFATQRPTLWRQAVDLANMMLILALRAHPQKVYARARHHFVPEDIAEAFAATRGVTIPKQLRTLLGVRRQRGRDLIAEFRDLAPPADPIKIQRWSVRRLLLIAGLAVAGSLLALLLIDNLHGAGFF